MPETQVSQCLEELGHQRKDSELYEDGNPFEGNWPNMVMVVRWLDAVRTWHQNCEIVSSNESNSN